jgi:hypothetical protein
MPWQAKDFLADLKSSLDGNGTLVSLRAVDWLVCFVPGLEQEWWHRFVHPAHQHVFAMRPLRGGLWLVVESWKKRLSVASVDVRDALKFMRWASVGDVLRAKEHLPGRALHTPGWSNCAVLTALLLGRRSWTWTPHGLYRRLVNEPGVSRVDMDTLLCEMEQMSRCTEIDAVKKTRVKQPDGATDGAPRNGEDFR